MFPKEPLASIIRTALEGYATGRFQTQAEVARYLESQPDFPKNRFGKVTIEAANRILTRVLYAGYVEKIEWNISLRKGRHKGLISLETYQRIQERLNSKARVPVKTNISADFPLRGQVVCSCEKPLTACWSKSKTGKKHPYYMCYNKDCESYRKSIPRAKIEEEFETMLGTIKPSQTMVELAKAMFHDAWEMQKERGLVLRQSVQRKLADTEKQIATLLDRIVEASSASVVSAYETRLDDLEREKLVLAEKLETTGKPQRSFHEMFELAMQFLSNPQNLWRSERLEDKITTLKLSFSEKLVYQRNEGFRTPRTSKVFAVLESMELQSSQMAEREGVDLNSLFEELADWEAQLKPLEKELSSIFNEDYEEPIESFDQDSMNNDGGLEL